MNSASAFSHVLAPRWLFYQVRNFLMSRKFYLHSFQGDATSDLRNVFTRVKWLSELKKNSGLLLLLLLFAYCHGTATEYKVVMPAETNNATTHHPSPCINLQHTYLKVVGSNPVTAKNFFGTKFNCSHEGSAEMKARKAWQRKAGRKKFLRN